MTSFLAMCAYEIEPNAETVDFVFNAAHLRAAKDIAKRFLMNVAYIAALTEAETQLLLAGNRDEFDKSHQGRFEDDPLRLFAISVREGTQDPETWAPTEKAFEIAREQAEDKDQFDRALAKHRLLGTYGPVKKP